MLFPGGAGGASSDMKNSAMLVGKFELNQFVRGSSLIQPLKGTTLKRITHRADLLAVHEIS